MKKIIKSIIVTIIMAILFSKSIYADEDISINAKASLMVELNSGKVVYEDNAEEINYPASTTKMVTALVVLDKCKLDEIVTVSQNAIDSVPDGYVFAPLYEGEEMKVEDLLYALLLPSASDAACALAEHVAGSIDEFVELMNRKVELIGCKNTHFTNPHGVHDEDHYTTAYDLYLIANYAMQNETFAKIVSTYEYTLPATNKHLVADRVMENTNYFLEPDGYYYNGDVKGIKTGTTVQAGNCIISYFTKDEFDAITVVLGAETKYTKFTESTKLFNYLTDNFIFTDICKKGDNATSIDVANAKNDKDKLNLVIGDDIRALHNKNINATEVEPEIILNENITAPIQRGQELGVIKYSIDGVDYTAKLLAEKEVKAKDSFWLIVFIIIIASLVLLRIRAIHKKKKKKYGKKYTTYRYY